MDENYKPVVTLFVKSPWTGSEANFALYESGLLLYRWEPHQFFSVQLDESERTEFIDALPFEAFFELRKGYPASTATDQPDNFITLWKDGTAKRVRIYGNLFATSFDHRTDVSSPLSAEPQNVEAFWTIFERLRTYRHERAQRWLPEKIKVKVWEWEGVKDALPWDATWPDLNHPETLPSPHSLYNAHDIMLPSEHLEELERLRREHRGVLMNDKTWSLAYHLPIPNEDWIQEIGWK